MPELPEVETIRRGLVTRLLNRRVVSVDVHKPKLVHGNVRKFVHALQGNAFVDIARRGKLLIFHLKSGGYMLIHLKMTGQLIYVHGRDVVAGGHQFPAVQPSPRLWPAGAPSGGGGYGRQAPLVYQPGKYTHVIFTFSDGSHLYFNDQRQFGFLQVVDVKQLERALTNYGMDPLEDDISWEDFYDMMRGRSTGSRSRGRKTTIKAALLNQKLVAGIGNIYADEILFAAKVRPGRRVSSLTRSELQAIYQHIPRVLKRALKHGGTTFQDYRDADGAKGNFVRLLRVYGRKGQACKRCHNGIIQKREIAGRGTHWCNVCQR